jgi:hypothetical protein
MQVGDHVRMTASGWTGTIESTTEQSGEIFYNVRYDPEAAQLVTGSPDSEVILGIGRKSLELIP